MRDPTANTSSPGAAFMYPRLVVAVTYLVSCIVSGIYLPFFPLFLAERGLEPDSIGLALALPMAIRLAAMPTAGVLSDHWGTPRTMLVSLGLASAIAFAIVGLASGTIWILLAVGLTGIFWTPVFPLLEAYATRLAHIGAVDYGRARLWGSISFVGANLAGGFLLDWMPVAAIIWLIVGAVILFTLTARTLPALPSAEVHETRQPLGRPSKVLLLGVAAAACVQASHALLYGFSSLQWRDGGLDTSTIGILWSIGTGTEIVLFYVGTQLLGKFSALSMIMLGGIVAALRFCALAFDPPVALLIPLQMLHAFTYGATHLGLMALIVQNTPAHMAGRAQTFSSAMLGVVMAVATIAAGPLYASSGTAAYRWFALLGATGAAIAFVAILQPQSSRSGGETSAPS